MQLHIVSIIDKLKINSLSILEIKKPLVKWFSVLVQISKPVGR